MQRVVSELERILKSDYIQNANLLIGQKLQELHSIASRGYSHVKYDLEPICIQLITANNDELSTVNATYVGRLLVLCYKDRGEPEMWKCVSVLGEEIRKNSLQSIIMLGVFAKHVGEQIKYSLPRLVYSILDHINIYSPTQQVFACQCIRRMMKGAGTFLRSECSDIISYLFKGLSSTNANEPLLIEFIKSVPILYEYADYSIKKLMMPMDGLISSNSKKIKFFVAKVLAKLIFIQGSITQKNQFGQPIYDPKRPFKTCFNILLELANKEEYIQTICHTIMIWIRFMDISLITEYIPLFVKFALSIVQFNLPLTYTCTFTRTVFRAVTSVIGSTYEPLFCHYVFDDSRKAGFTTANTMITLDTLINFRASTKTITKAAKTFYPLLSTPDRDVVRMVSSFFVVVGRRDQKSSQILIDSFIQWLTSDDVKPMEIFGFSRGAATLIMTCPNINRESINQICDICRKWLHESIEVSSQKFSAALLLCSAVFKKSPKDFPMQLLLVAFRALTRYFRNGEKLTEENMYLSLPMKYGAILMKQVILSNIPTITSLYPTIQQSVIVISHNSAVLSSPTLLSVWLSIRSCKPAWHISLPQSMMNAAPIILARFFDPKENNKDYGMRKACDEVDPAEELYGTKLPNQFYSFYTDKLETIYTLLVADVRTPMRDELVNVVLRDYPSWAILAANPLKKSTLAQLFSPYQEQDITLFQLRLTLLRSIAKKPHIAKFIRPDGLRVLFGFELHDTRTTRMLGAAIAAYVNLDQTKFEDLLDFLENPKISGALVGAVVSELKFPPEREIEAIRCMLAIERLMISDQHPLEFFALIHLIELDCVPIDFVQQTVTILEQALYSDSMITLENVNYLSLCIDAISKVDIKHVKRMEASENEQPRAGDYSQYRRERERMAYAMLYLPFNRSFCTYRALTLMPEEQRYPIDYKFSIQRPRPILEAHAKQLHSMQDIVIILDILQQGPSIIAKRKLQERLIGYKVISFWLTLAKQVLIKGWVPFANVNTKISPSVYVIEAVVSILDMMAQMLSRMYPKNSDRLGELLTISVSILENKDTNTHTCVYKLLTNFIDMFKHIKYQERPSSIMTQFEAAITVKPGSSSLVEYEEILQNAFRTVFDKSHDISDGISFVLSYFSYLHESRRGEAPDKFLTEAQTIISNEIPRLQSGEREKFIRLTGGIMSIIAKPMKGVVNIFVDRTNDFIVEVMRQSRRVDELHGEAHSAILTFLRINTDFQLESGFMLCLLREMDLYDFNDSMLKLFTHLLIRRSNKPTTKPEFMKELIDYSLICVGKSRYFKKEARSLELKESSLPGYLQTLAIRIPSATFYNQQSPGKWEKEWEATWRNILSLSLIRKPSFVAIGLLLRCAPNNLIMELAQPIVANIMDNETEECGSVLFLLFSRLANITHGVKSIDEIIFNVIRSLKSKDSAKFHVIVQALRSMKQAYDISSLGDIAKLVGFFFLPNGAKFVGNLLCDRRTIVYGLNILRMGIADQVFRSEFDVEHIDTIMDLMIVATNVIHSYFPIDSWDKETIKFALNNLTNMRPGVNQQQIQHILALIKLLNTQAIAPIISQFKYLPNVISSLYGQ